VRAISKPFAPDDPLTLVGVALPDSDGALEEMARTFVQEYLLQGWDERRLLALFRNPFYRAPHLVYRVCGEEYVRRLIAEVLAGWGQQPALQEGSDDA